MHRPPADILVLVRWVALLLALSVLSCSNLSLDSEIDRYALVARHNPSVQKPDSLSSFTVGNGEFAFTADFTGLQTFPEFYEAGVPLGTQSHWGWHTIPPEKGYTLKDTYEQFDTYGRPVNYASIQGNDAARWLRANPHRLHLGHIGFRIAKSDGSTMTLLDAANIQQTLDMWAGTIHSTFEVEGEPVAVATACHPHSDLIAVDIRSKLIANGQLSVSFRFPYGSTSWGKETADYTKPERHLSKIVRSGQNSTLIERQLDSDVYYVTVSWSGDARFSEIGTHQFQLSPTSGDGFAFSAAFSPAPEWEAIPRTPVTFAAASSYWQKFWTEGGAIDLSRSSDSRATELERRIVLSQYLLAVQCAGSMPPAETGLTCNSWHGKFHLEMHWWHAVQFALWGRAEHFRRSLAWYKKTAAVARENARAQGYAGARWGKMVGPAGRESPSGVGVFLIWQQPHPIYYTEQFYRILGTDAWLQEWKDIVFDTAEFMASYAYWDEGWGRYVLGPPLIPAQEVYRPAITMNPAFELSYWRYGLSTAQKWRERLGLEREKKWDHVITHLSGLPENDHLYQNAETALNTFEDKFHRNDHPTVLGAFGMLPNETVDAEQMRRTLSKVMEMWNWQRTWGWDYPLVAMTAARVGRPDLAIDALLMDVQKNTYLNNGHNYQDDRLTLYLPGNGGLLSAVAMMAAGWDGGPETEAPGFPKNGKWTVKYEGLFKYQ